MATKKATPKAAPDTVDVSMFQATADTQKGFEQINNRTMAIPFLRILQSGSPQLKRSNDQFIDGAEEGMFYNTVTKKVYGRQLELIVLAYENVYIEWMPDRGGFVAMHTIQNAERIATAKEFAHWMHGENPLQENYVYMCVIVGEESEGPIVLSLASTMLKTARIWNRLLTTHVVNNIRIATSALVWNLTTEAQKNAKGEWYTPSFEFVRLVNQEQYEITKKERLALPSRQIDYAQLEGSKDGESEEGDTSKVNF